MSISTYNYLGSVESQFDTSQITFSASPTITNFALEAPGTHSSLTPICARNTSNKTVVITYAKFGIVNADTRIIPNPNTSNNLILSAANLSQYFGFLTRGLSASMTDYVTLAYNFQLAHGDSLVVPATYAQGANSFILLELAGFAHDPLEPGLMTNMSPLSVFNPGSVLQSFKMTPNFLMPFYGTVIAIQD